MSEYAKYIVVCILKEAMGNLLWLVVNDYPFSRENVT